MVRNSSCMQVSRRDVLKGFALGGGVLTLSGLGLLGGRAYGDEVGGMAAAAPLDDGGYYLFDVLEPYQEDDMICDETYQMASDSYAHGLRVDPFGYNTDGSLYFNLKGAYSRITFVLGHIDGFGMNDATFTFEGDGRSLASFEVEAKSLPYAAEVSVDGVTQLIISAKGTACAMTEIKIYPAGAASSTSDTSATSSSQPTVVPDGTYPIAVDDEGATATVTIAVAGNAVTGLTIDSATGSASPAAILAAFEQLIKTQGVAAETDSATEEESA